MTFKKFLRFWICIVVALFGMTFFADKTYAVNKYARVILVGNLGSGKTSLWKSFFNSPYDPNEMSSDSMMRRDYTIAVAGDNVQFNIWDTAGMAKYYDEVVAFTKDANFVFIVHDISSRYDSRSEAYLSKLYRDVHSQIKADGAIVLVGTKNDKRHDDIANASKQRLLLENVAKAIPCAYFFTEAPDGKTPTIDALLQLMVSKSANMTLSLSDPDTSTVKRFTIKKGSCTLL